MQKHTSFPLRLVIYPLLLIFAASAGGAELSGRLVLIDEDGQRSSEMAQAVIYFTPEGGVEPSPLPEPTEVVTSRKQFIPRVAAVPQGSEVAFPNADPILHNVFSVSGRNRFDLGFYRKGESKSHTFDHPGVARIYCNVHHDMIAHVLVLETPFYTRPERDGSFRLGGLPAGPGTLTAWHERSRENSVELTVPTAAPVEIRLEIDRPLVPKHKNKFGKPYSRKSRGRRY